MMVGSGLVALLIAYLAEFQGYDFLLCAVIVYFAFCGVYGALRGFLFPAKLERDPGADVGTILGLKGPPDSSSKS
jgi:hypothetical protein